MHSSQGSYAFFLLGSKAALQTPTKLNPYLKCIARTELVTSDLALCYALILIFECSTPEDQPLSAGVVCITLTQQNWQLGWSWKAEPSPNFRPVWFEVVVGWHKVTFRMTVILFLRPVTKLRKSLCPRMASLVLCNCFKIKTTWKKKGIISYEGVKKFMSDEFILLKMTLIWALLYF